MSENDISMVDVSNALDSISNDTSRAPARRKSTLILTDEAEGEKMHVEETGNVHDSQQTSQNQQNAQNAQNAQNVQHQNQPQGTDAAGNSGADTTEEAVNVPVDITWVQGGDKVYVTGSFTGWRKMIGLQKQADGSHVVTLGLPVGTHRFRFVIDNELRFSDFLPTATDQMGNFVNYVEVTPEHVASHLRQQSQYAEEQRQKEAGRSRGGQPQGQGQGQVSRVSSRRRAGSVFGLTGDDDDMGNGYSRYYDDEADDTQDGGSQTYTSEIPPIFVDAKVMEQYYMAVDEQAKANSAQQQAWLHAPQLPPQLDNVILNNFNAMDRHNNSGALPIPNHVVLNHLATTSIKHNTLAVASVVRYKRKYVTQVLYAPLS